ncbi:SNF2 family N-terminal domain-containing protein [Hypomontagnella monticulosa]|nr:SNF2 family N-terminal domain-containing protein [Hypomontagnella monticulosa]
MIKGLLEEGSLVLYVTCLVDSKPISRKNKRGSHLSRCNLEITVYGPISLFEDIGAWFEENEVFLQDPEICHLDARYCNPQRLSADDTNLCPFLSEMISSKTAPMLQEISEQIDWLDTLSTNIHLEEAAQPEAIRSQLKRHQKQALSFMQRRELGWNFEANHPDIWDKIDTEQGRMFINTISKSQQCSFEEPPPFSGGIIADPMGLGKTLTMIALVASDQCHMEDTRINPWYEDIDHPEVPTTLVVIPPPLIGSWEEQLSDHVFQDHLKFCRHHGKTRLTEITELHNVNLVLTTYHTVSNEWKADGKAGNSVLFSTRWRRVILDEAHFIRNRNTKMARAICALDSVSRWAVTGTPIQNRLSDLAALFSFIRAFPYDNPKIFDDDISRPWKFGEGEESIKKLKRLSASILLRRPKSTIELPPRRDLQCPVNFSIEERAVYEDIKHSAITRIDELLQDDSGPSKAHKYANILQQIEALRLFSNLGLHYHSRHNMALDRPAETDWEKIAQNVFNSQRAMGPMICIRCSSVLGLAEAFLEDPSSTRGKAQISSCLKFLCAECSGRDGRHNRTIACGHSPPCSAASISTDDTTIDEVGNFPVAQTTINPNNLPSKIKALIADLMTVPSDVKCIAFSTWRLTLDLIEAGLKQASLPCIRFDGKVPQKDRQAVVEEFRSNPNIRVMLLTLSCGAVGLTLTAASRAYLMEPHWNPTLEEQALARVHRLGQKKEVTTVRFYVRDSFEEQVMNLQESKKQLAGVLLSNHDGGHDGDNMGTLERLRALL